MKIMTWSVNRFNGNSSSEIWDKAKIRYSNSILKYIEQEITGKDDVAIIQEFPCKGQIVDDFKEKFTVLSWYEQDDKFGDINNRNNRFKSRTVALVKKESSNWDLVQFKDSINFGQNDAGQYNYVNKYVQLINTSKEITLLGIHMPTRDTKKGEGGMEDLNDAIKNAIENKKNIPNIIVGDFNAGDYQKEEEEEDFTKNKEKYIETMKDYNYKDIIDKSTTNYQQPTFIDHFWTEKETKNSFLCECNITPKVIYKKELSDHYPIVVKLKKRKKSVSYGKTGQLNIDF